MNEYGKLPRAIRQIGAPRKVGVAQAVPQPYRTGNSPRGELSCGPLLANTTHALRVSSRREQPPAT